MNSNPIVILDLDGTLLDTSTRHFHVYRETASEFRISPLPLPEYWTLRRAGMSNLAVLKQQGLDAASVERAAKIWLSRIENVQLLALDSLFTGVREWLTLAASRARLVLITLRSDAPSLHAQLHRLEISKMFHNIIVVPHQPDPARAKFLAFTHAAPDQRPAAWIGDTEVDMSAARMLGTPPIAVSSGMREPAALTSAGASQVFSSITEIPFDTIDIQGGIHERKFIRRSETSG